MGNNVNETNRSRKKSNISNWVLLIIGGGIIIGDVIFLCFNYSDQLEGWSNTLLKVSPFILFWATVIIVVSIILIKSVNDLNKQLEKKMFPYSFDYVKELAIYKVVGSSKQKVKCDGVELNIYSNYSDWKNHITEEYRKKDCIIQRDFENFYRFLIKRKRIAESRKEMTYEILLPVELGAIGVCCGSDGLFDEPITCAIGVVVGSCIFMWQVMKEQFNNEDEINFIDDFLEIMDCKNLDCSQVEEESVARN